jgi:hypothetical protein
MLTTVYVVGVVILLSTVAPPLIWVRRNRPFDLEG